MDEAQKQVQKAMQLLAKKSFFGQPKPDYDSAILCLEPAGTLARVCPVHTPMLA